MDSTGQHLYAVTTSDLDRIERDLADVEMALERLEAGTYWADEITGEDLPTELLVADPLIRRLP